MSNNVLASIGIAAFATSMLMASGPLAVAFSAALIYSSIIALSLVALSYVMSEAAHSSSLSIGSSSASHDTTFAAANTATPSRRFVSTPVVTPVVPLATHTRNFIPGGVGARSAAAVPIIPTTPVTHTKAFVPGGVRSRPAAVPTVIPSRATTSHTRAFVPGGVAKPTVTINRTAMPPKVNTTVSHTRTSVVTDSTPTHTRTFIRRP